MFGKEALAQARALQEKFTHLVSKTGSYQLGSVPACDGKLRILSIPSPKQPQKPQMNKYSPRSQ